jgi:hypothetical protein
MSGIHQAMILLLASYATRGRFARPNDVTAQDIDEIKRLGATAADDLAKRLRLPSTTPRPNNGLRATIEQLDKQVDTYENLELLVSFS